MAVEPGYAINKRTAIFLGALSGFLLFLTACSGTKSQQILCTLSKDSIPAFNFRELLESAKLARDAYRDTAANVKTYGSKYRVEVFPLPKSSGQVLFLKDTVARRQIISIRGTETKYVKSVLTDAQYTKQLDSCAGLRWGMPGRKSRHGGGVKQTWRGNEWRFPQNVRRREWG